MKKIFYLGLSILFLCVAITGCSQKEEIDIQKNAPAKVIQKETANDIYDRIDVYQYLSENKDIFGNPMVFNSLDDADNLLDSLQSMDSQELGAWIENNNFHNPIIESNYRYLSSYEAKQIEFASMYFASENDRLTAIINAVANEMESNYPTLCVISEYITADNNLVKSVKTLGDFDLYALCNEQGIVIIDKVVYWFVDNNLITCPINKFASVANQSNVCSISENTNLNENEEDYVVAYNVISDVTSLQQAQVVDDHFRYYEASKGDYKLTVYMTAYPYWGWGSTNYRSKTTVTNLYNGSEYKTTTSGNFYYFALGQYGDLRANLYFYAYKSTNIQDEFKSKTYRENILMNQYTKTTETYVDIQRVNVNITQDTGTWDGMYRRVVTIKVNE